MAVRALTSTSSFKYTSRSNRDPLPQDLYQQVVVPGPGLRLLTFDDGGVRGLTMLLLLRAIMHHIQQANHEPTLPLPCEYFDMIAGSGTGGFIALLLGRLRLSIEHAIECYTRVVNHVFVQTKGDGTFRATPLEKVLREISHRFGDGEDTPILDSNSFPCRTFVCIREAVGSSNAIHRKLRTYAHPTEPGARCTFLEAVRATMGNPTFFKPPAVSRSKSPTTLLDAGDDHCNPVFDLYEESQFLYPSRHFAYLLSLGPGTADTVGVNPSRAFVNQPRLPSLTLSALRRLADNCDRIATSFREQHSGEFDGNYFRMTPAPSSYDGKLRWEEPEALQEFIAPYFASIYQQVCILVVAMMNE